jgi:transcriptional regulator with XRE-family HTH domain
MTVSWYLCIKTNRHDPLLRRFLRKSTILRGNFHMIGSRLKEERERLRMTQEAFAAVAQVKRRTLVDWEKGVSSPTAVQLSALIDVGVDTHYILTGTRNVGNLTPEEAVLVDNFRNSPEVGRDAIKRTAFALAQSEVKGKAA